MHRTFVYESLLCTQLNKLGTAPGTGSTALDLPGLGPVDVVSGDPLCVVGRGRSDSWAVRNRDLLIDLLRRTSGLSGVTRLSALALLGEVRRNPDRVEKVHDTAEARQKEEVQEDTV